MMKDKSNKSQHILPQIRREAALLIFTLIYAFSLSMLTSNILHFSLSPLSIFALVLLSSLIFSVLFFNALTWVISMGTLALAALIIFLSPLKNSAFLSDGLDKLSVSLNRIGQLLARFGKEGFGFFNENLTADEKASYAFFAILVVIALTLISFLLIQKIRSYWFPAFLLILLVPVSIKNADPWAAVFLVPMALACFGMILLSSGHLLDLLRKKKGIRQLLAAGTQLAVVLLLAALLAVLSVSRLTYHRLYSPFWQGIVDDLMTLFPEGLQPRLTVTPFSLGEDGFYPLGNRLGGPVEEKDDVVALIEGQAPALLKVQSSDYYDGLRWQRVLNNPNYRYNSPFNGGSEMDVFNDKPAAAFMKALAPQAEKMIYQSYDYKLTPSRFGTQLLFSSGTPTYLRSSREEALLFYFNQAGTLFARSTFDTKHPYEVKSLYIEAGAIGLGSGSAAEAEGFRPIQLETAYEKTKAESPVMGNRAQAYQYYLQLPDMSAYKDGGSVYELAQSLTSGLKSGYTKVAALLKYFTDNPEFTYRLNVQDPPENVDFVSHFLSTKTGYCTYYASAMTMLCRLAGVPARYVEGYALNAQDEAALRLNNKFKIESKNAHAWTEVYLDGLGWVDVDATPGGVAGSALPDSQKPSPTPSPTPTPTPTPPAQTTTAPTATPTTPPAQTTPPQTEDEDKSFPLGTLLIILAVLLLLGLIILLALLYIKRRKAYIHSLHEPAALAAKFGDNKRRADFYWQQLLALLALHPQYGSPAPGLTEQDLAVILARAERRAQAALSTPAEKGKRSASAAAAETAETGPEPGSEKLAEWAALAALTAEARYSEHHLSDHDLAPLAAAFDVQEELTRKLLGERAYLFKRILPPQQGKLPKD